MSDETASFAHPPEAAPVAADHAPVSEREAALLIEATERVAAPPEPRTARLRSLVRNMFRTRLRLAIERSHVRVALVGLAFLGCSARSAAGS